MSSHRWFALTLLVAIGGVAAGCGGSSGEPGETSVTPAAVPVSITRTGGLAGVNQSIEIAADGTWVYTDNRRNQTENGSLAPDQRIQVLRLVADPAFTEQLTKAAKPDPGCADGFHYTIRAGGGETRSFVDCGADDIPAVEAAIAAVTEATPF